MTSKSQQLIPTFDLKLLLPTFHEHTLPSNGNFSGIPSTINVRGLTVKELKHLTASGRFDKKIFDSCISSCVQESIEIQKLLIQDYNYLVYLVRLYTSGNKASGSKVCDNQQCRQRFNFEYDVTENSNVKFLEEPLAPVVTKTLPRFKQDHGFEVTIDVKPLTRADYLKIDTAIRQSAEMAAKLNQPISTYPLTELLKVHITQISGFPVPIVKDQLIDYFNADEANIITSAYPDDLFGLTGSATAICPVCGTEQQYVIPYTDLFFQ
jgi:hypothetical protein